MAQTSINIRIDEDLKNNFNKFCEEVGMSMSTAFCMFAKDTVKNQSLPFSITTKRRKDPFWSEKNQELLRKSIAEMEETGGMVKEI